MTNQTRRPIYICSYCHSRVESDQELREHKARHEREMLTSYRPAPMPRPFCPACGSRNHSNCNA